MPTLAKPIERTAPRGCEEGDSAPTRIWLCDLTYTQQTISSDIMPAAVGCIAAYVKDADPDRDVRIFKFPEKLVAALADEPPPHIVGFSNYVWNCELSSGFARVIKDNLPQVVTVMGGPNYAKDEPQATERKRFFDDQPMIDFYIPGEGETAFLALVETLEANAFAPSRVPLDLPSVHRTDAHGEVTTPAPAPRIIDLDDIPSPYLTGLMDEFFDGRMQPIVQTNRGCPFRCTFCIEGSTYFSRVNKHMGRKSHEELAYIAGKMTRLHDEVNGRTDLYIADSNFGMYKEDLDICRTIRRLRQTHGYPQYINVSTGKNNKERVLEAASLVDGAMMLSGAVQSLDGAVLENIDRRNIDAEGIISLGLAANAAGANSYSDIILGLPGETPESHLATIRTIVDAGFNTVVLHQLMMLPGTKLATPESRREWGMETRFRVLPRCFGHFEALGETICAAEIEEVCVATSSLSIDDYVDCRHMHLIVNIFYNDGVFKETYRLIAALGLSVYDWLERLWRYRGNDALNALIGEFLDETVDELWDDEAALRAFVADKRNIERYISGELGSNLIFKFKAKALAFHADDLAGAAKETLSELLREAGENTEAIEFGHELVDYACLKTAGILTDPSAVRTGTFNYDVEGFARSAEPAELSRFRLSDPVTYRMTMNAEQQSAVRSYAAIYGTSTIGLSRTLARIDLRRLFRVPVNPGVAGAAD